MQNIIETHPYLLQYAFRTTGHHGTWAYAKRWIRTNQVNGQRGLIPDFIAAMSNSLGYSWQIIALKRPDVQFANKRGDGLSTEAHKALAQRSDERLVGKEYVNTCCSRWSPLY